MKKGIVLLGLLLVFGVVYAQPNWQNKDLKADGIFGISTDKAYKELLVGKTSKPVIVAIIDMGLDTAHEDLKGSLWTNPRKTPTHGYRNDTHGWNFIGAEIGKEDVELLALHDTSRANQQYLAEYQSHINGAKGILQNALNVKTNVEAIVKALNKANPTVVDFQQYQAKNDDEAALVKAMIALLLHYPDFGAFKKREVDGVISEIQYHLDHGLSPDRYHAEKDLAPAAGYGNNDVCGAYTLLPKPGPSHGTHVAGIIAAGRNNHIGVNGIADNVQLMPLKCLSYLRELREHDLVNAIRYAADNGAKVINLSFGKSYTLNKKAVDEAIKYAMAKDVLFIKAAGNEGKDLENEKDYPNPVYADSSGRAAAWLNVGASNSVDDDKIVANFSNYGKTKVDVFAPGVDIFSTIPGNDYDFKTGTSMAAPVVTGMAALIREYYPKLTADQVKEIIVKTVSKVDHLVRVRDSNGYSRRVPFTAVCSSGGVVNVYSALQLAATY